LKRRPDVVPLSKKCPQNRSTCSINADVFPSVKKKKSVYTSMQKPEMCVLQDCENDMAISVQVQAVGSSELSKNPSKNDTIIKSTNATIQKIQLVR
jgi:hypothetical protein